MTGTRNSVFYSQWILGLGGEVPGTEFEGFDDGGDFFESLGVEDLALRGVRYVCDDEECSPFEEDYFFCRYQLCE
jgi:hypothetical protein